MISSPPPPTNAVDGSAPDSFSSNTEKDRYIYNYIDIDN